MRPLRTSPPTQAELDAAFGLPMPAPFLCLLTALIARAGGSRERLDEDSRAILGFALYGPVERALVPGLTRFTPVTYQQTPPELFPIGTTNVDGDHYGYIVHAPELALHDYPIASLCPMDSDGAALAGKDTPTAVENLISFWMRYADDPEEDSDFDPAAAAAIAAALQVDPAISKADQMYGPEENGYPAAPTAIPDGWAWAPSEDGVGTLAPIDAFGGAVVDYRKHELAGFDGGPIKDAVQLAEQHLQRASPASALALLREVYWYRWGEPGAMAAITPVMAQAYESLGRGLLAGLTLDRARRFSGMRK